MNEKEVFLTDEQINKFVEDVIRSCYFVDNNQKQQINERMKKRFEQLRRKPEQQNQFETPALFAYGPFETPFEIFGPNIIVFTNKEDTKK